MQFPGAGVKLQEIGLFLAILMPNQEGWAGGSKRFRLQLTCLL